jgi:hypothetical protein
MRFSGCTNQDLDFKSNRDYSGTRVQEIHKVGNHLFLPNPEPS